VLSTRRSPELSAVDADGVRHDGFRIGDYGAHVELQGLVKNAEAIIADGHHRWETAIAFSKDPAAAKLPGARFKLCALVDIASEGLIVRPTHRLISGIPDWNPRRVLETARGFFDLRELPSAGEAGGSADAPRLLPAFVLYAPPAADPPDAAEPGPLPWLEGRPRRGEGSTRRPEVAFFSKLLASTPRRSPAASASPSPRSVRAIAAVDTREAQGAILMRPTMVLTSRRSLRRRAPAAEIDALFPKGSGLFGVSLEEPVLLTCRRRDARSFRSGSSPALRLAFSRVNPVNYDGYWHVFIARNLSREYGNLAHPPLFLLLLKASGVLSHSRLGLQAIAIGSGLAVVALIHKLLERLRVSPAVAGLGALTIAVAPSAVLLCGVQTHARPRSSSGRSSSISTSFGRRRFGWRGRAAFAALASFVPRPSTTGLYWWPASRRFARRGVSRGLPQRAPGRPAAAASSTPSPGRARAFGRASAPGSRRSDPLLNSMPEFYSIQAARRRPRS
jgi:hypothetical protein